MPPRVASEDHPELTHTSSSPTKSPPPKVEIVWFNVAVYATLHALALWGVVRVPQAMWQTLVFSAFGYVFAALGVTAGVHRLWAHRSYKAGAPLRVFLMLCNSISFQNSILEWSRDHRVHHKFSETAADPHDATRGFFFAHVGWLLVRKRPEVKEKGKTISMADLHADPVVMFQHRHHMKIGFVMTLVLPTLIPVYCWGEGLLTAYLVAAVMRFVTVLNITWLVNSAAHMWGNKPYDESINPAENKAVAALSFGEGFHNYHHTFPSDYAAGELGQISNPTKWFIDACCWLGLASDRKRMTKDMIFKRRARTGDLKPREAAASGRD